MSKTTIIRDAAWIVAWDGANERHAYLRDADVVFTGDAITHSSFLGQFSDFATSTTRGCVLMETPHELADFMGKVNARDTSGRNRFAQELRDASPCPCHHVPGKAIPEQDPMYRFAKKHWFFGFGAYG